VTKSFYITSKSLDENLEFEEDIKKYGSSKESLYLVESTGDQIKIGFNGKLKCKNSDNKIEFLENELIINDFVWNWAEGIAFKLPKLITGEKISLTTYVYSLKIDIEPLGKNVKLNFSGFVKGEFIADFDEFVSESFSFLDKFVNHLLKMNPKLIQHKIFLNIVEGRDKIKQMLRERK